MSENQDGPSSIRVVSEAESDGPGNESEPDDTQVNESMSTGSKKRSREADYSVEQKGKAPKKQTSGNEASTSRQQPKQKETKDDGNKVKNINCKIDRRKKTDKMTDMEVLLWKKLVPFPDSLQIPASFNQIRNEWPLRPDLQKISQKMQDIKTKSNNDVTLDGLNQELDALGKKRKEQERALGAVLDIDMATEIQIERCSEYMSWLLPQVQVQDQVEDQDQVQVEDQVQVQVQDQDQVQDQVQENLFTPEGMQLWSSENQLYDEDNISLSANEGIQFLVRRLENELYDNNNNEVSFEDFEGLAGDLEKTTGLAPLPDKLKPFAAQIKEARGETGINHMLIEVIVCAAIKEMKCLPSKSVNWNMLKKWGATLSYAKHNGFQVSFADLLLKKNWKSYVLESLLTNEEFPSNLRSVGRLLTNEEIGTWLTSLEDQIYDGNNNEVSFKDFEWLEEELEKTKGSAPLPDKLKSIAAQIKGAHGKDTGINHLSIEVIVCAAINDMERLPSESVNWDMLKKWGAILNYAKQNGFQVSFADLSLKRNLKSYVLDNYSWLRNLTF
ncbi:hypothetical protein E1A91_A11G360800v1 [Gossypium mustelinum]|uniref:Uncharacterized protein n=1 Tax=Gossypium mustelinum TaxID=34275 RepID=A0A5D2XFB1_GOSMU|nr:hypothetical protein E1A91_A11G360800v1 [Gossypium mustelinum]